MKKTTEESFWQLHLEVKPIREQSSKNIYKSNSHLYHLPS